LDFWINSPPFSPHLPHSLSPLSPLPFSHCPFPYSLLPKICHQFECLLAYFPPNFRLPTSDFRLFLSPTLDRAMNPIATIALL
jgi:hypothetical protein